MNIKKYFEIGKKFITSADARFLYLAKLGVYNNMPDEEYLKKRYQCLMHNELDLDHPRTFNEKLQWLKLHDRNPLYTALVDKVEVKKYVAEKIGEEYIIPTLGVWEDPDEIDFDSLPDQFVLKCNHDSGGIVICKDKSQLDRNKVKKKLRKSLKNDFYLVGREWPYKNVKRKILAEKYMVDESGTELKDYKIFNFDGEPKLIEVDYDRFVQHKRNLYSTDWEYINAAIQYPTDPEHEIGRPEKLEEMLGMARKLSDGIPHVRTDFYCIDYHVYFGEITFFHGCGFDHFSPKEFEDEFSSWLKIPRGGVFCS